MLPPVVEARSVQPAQPIQPVEDAQPAEVYDPNAIPPDFAAGGEITSMVQLRLIDWKYEQWNLKRQAASGLIPTVGEAVAPAPASPEVALAVIPVVATPSQPAAAPSAPPSQPSFFRMLRDGVDVRRPDGVGFGARG